VDWRNFFEGIFYSLLPKEYWRSWRPTSTVDFARSAITSGLIECGGFLYLLVYGYFHFLAVRTHQLQPVEGANEGTQLYFFSVLTVEYAFHPLSLLALCLSGEGALRSWAAFFTDEIVPSLPIKLAALTQAWLKMRRMEKSIGPDIPDLFERPPGMAYDIQISAQRPKDGWRVSITVAVEDEFYEVVRVETSEVPRPFIYFLRRLLPGIVIRGAYRYDPPKDPRKEDQNASVSARSPV
jgi:hypothetical protein